MRSSLVAALLLLGSAKAFSLKGGFLGAFKQNPALATKAAVGMGPSGWLSSGKTASGGRTSTALAAATASAPILADPIGEYCAKHGGNRPIRKVLIANNGMAATKSIMSMRQWAYMELGDEKAIEFVAMATPEDMKANAEFIKLADSFVEVPAGKNSNNYANVDVIVQIAKDKGVDAVWPGWGHASENPRLPDTLNAVGIKFIGPNGQVMAALGDKIAANILAQTAGVPSIPWSGTGLTAQLGEDGKIPQAIFDSAMVTTAEEACAAAAKIGYPVMLKASEGGGGKGIRMSDNEAELRTNFVQVSNEVPGSPMFMMQLCQGARHLEVQIVGDEHGNAVAVNGRDCSTQRRFQKIFEEGPPTIAQPPTFREMEKAAQRLTQSIGYTGAGTVEYLYNAASDDFFFLELNPRLQVEHPVTEGISLVNMPATQLQVAMGIPLNRIPDIRRFYAKDDPENGDSPIDFLEEDYRPIDTHVIAARITAENPDEGFKPTSGTIERVKFQSTTNVWGYFSVGANGGIHEFADSQFGHLFARGPTREAARKSLVLALKEIEVRGEIRTTVDYLVQLLETEEFKQNTIDTSWLDGIIREKSVSTEMDPHTTVAAAAIYRAHTLAAEQRAEHEDALSKGQLSMGSLASATVFSLEVTHKNVKYAFSVTRSAEDVFVFACAGGASYEAKVRAQPDGSLLATFGGKTQKIVGREEPLGLRITLDGTTCLLPNVFDPSELRTDVTGKVVRFLQADGENVEKGAPYVEVEAMKMIMPLKASESGAIKHELSAGSIIAAGDLIASLALEDPSRVQKIETFAGNFDLAASTPPNADGPLTKLELALAGWEQPDALVSVQELVVGSESPATFAAAAVGLVDQFLAVETQFDGAVDLDAANLALVKANQGSLGAVVAANLAHRKLAARQEALAAILRAFDASVIRQGGSSDAMSDRLATLAALKDGTYAPLKLLASEMSDRSRAEPFDVRLAALRKKLTSAGNLADLAASNSLTAGVELLTTLFADKDAQVRTAALETYIRRVYRAHDIVGLTMGAEGGAWQFKYSDVAASAGAPTRLGHIAVLPVAVSDSAGASATLLDGIVGAFAEEIGTATGESLHNLQLVFAESADDVSPGSEGEAGAVAAAAALVVGQAEKLKAMGVRQVDVCVPRRGQDPRYFSFTACSGFLEAPERRDMRPTFVHLLELARLQKNYDLDRLPSLGSASQVYLGEDRNAKGRGPKPRIVFSRAIKQGNAERSIVDEAGAELALVKAMDQLDRSMLDPRVTATTSSRIFVNQLGEVEGMTAAEVFKAFSATMADLSAKYVTRLLKLKVDEIEVKVRVRNASGELQSVRLVASSMSGGWLAPSAFIEYPDPITGVTKQFCPINEGGVNEEGLCFLDPYPSSTKLSLKRTVARRISSTYAYDFLGLVEVDLINRWGQHLEGLMAAGKAPLDARPPSGLFSAKELILDEATGELRDDVTREVGSNAVGMVAWVCSMKTPEYPSGREVVFIANDVTVQSGSFGVKEDDFFEAASLFARKHRLPRVYIACNSGARIGLVEELKPQFKVAWKDEANPGAGFDYLYLTEKDYEALPEGSVLASKTTQSGETRYALDAIVGQVHGIGVENLRGSGTIAGETARAYDDVFTLSYVTGRSVGIGAYLVRLGQRTIQMAVGPMILTGYSALNKLLGKEVYTSQDQLGGPQVMGPNGVSHSVVKDDQEGVAAIMEWLSFVPKTADDQPAALADVADDIDRKVEFKPTKAPYDPRHMLAGHVDPVTDKWVTGFFDQGTFKEYLAEWGKSVVVGRARLGGIPMGVIAVETRLVEQRIPADPANPLSREALQPQAGQVWYPDSAYKTAQAIADFGRGENLPLIIFANWRGFSGGTRDMAGEILKFGAMIVDALIKYEHPVQVYIPPNGELRGGAWVVIDPTINEEVMEMYCDQESRGGILEPPGICEVKFRQAEQTQKMHQLDERLIALDAEAAAGADVAAAIKEREVALMPLYLQVAHEFADLHDRAGRMKAKGVVRDVLTFEDSRTYLYWRVKRRVAEGALVKALKAQVGHKQATADVAAIFGDAYNGDKAFLKKLETERAAIDAAMHGLQTKAYAASVGALLAGLTEDQRAAVIKQL